MRQLILTGILCGAALAASCFWGAYTLEGTRPAVYPVKVVKIMQRPTFPSFPQSILDGAVGIERDGQLIGSGVLIKTGEVLTAAHCMRCPGRYTVRLGRGKDGHIFSSEITIKKIDEDLDLALLACFSKSIKPVRFAGAGIKIGTPVVSVGFPFGTGIQNVSPVGYISNKDCTVEDYWKKNWVVSAPCLHGNSGGGVYDVNTGYLVGIFVGFPEVTPYVPITLSVVSPAPVIQEFLNGQI